MDVGHSEEIKVKDVRQSGAIKDIDGRDSEAIKDLDVRHTEAIKDMDVRHSETMKDMDGRHGEGIKDLDFTDSDTTKNLDVRHGEEINDLEVRKSEAVENLYVRHNEETKNVDFKHSEAMKDLDVGDSKAKADLDVRNNEAIADFDVGGSESIKDFDVRHSEVIKDIDVRHSEEIKDYDVRDSEMIDELDVGDTEAMKDVRYNKALKDSGARHHGAKKDSGVILSEVIDGLHLRSKTEIPKDRMQRDKLIAKSKCRVERDLGLTDIVKISAYDIIISKLLKDGFAVITGISGDGKTTLAYHIIYDIMKDKIQGITGKEPLIISEPSQWKNAVGKSENLIIFIDDMFGISNETNLIEWREVIEDVEVVCSDKNELNRNYLLVAVRTDVLNGCPVSIKNHTLFQSLCDLRDVKNFSKNEKHDFLKKYNVETLFNSEERNKIVERSTEYLGFPQCCHLFFQDENLQKTGTEFFNQPFVFLKMLLRNLWDFEEIKFSALALVMLSGGQIHEEDFCTSDNFEKIKNVCCKEIPTNILRNCLDAAKSLERTYLSYDAEVFSFQHVSIYYAVAMVLWEYSCKEVIQHCSVDFLSSIQSKMSQQFQADSVIVSQYCFSVLAKRIVREISYTRPQTNKVIANLKIWENAEFAKTIDKEIDQQSERVNLNKEDENSYSLIHYAVRARNGPFVKYLFSHSPSKQQSYKAFNLACEVGDLEIFDICRGHMHSHKVELDSLFLSVKGGNEEIYKQLMKTFPDFNSELEFKSNETDETVTILQEICFYGKLDMLKLSIHDMTNDKFMLIATQQELLHFAAVGGCVRMLEYLIEKGVDVHQKVTEMNAAVLHWACLFGKLNPVKYLSQIPGILKATDKDNKTHLHYVAVGTGSVDVAMHLINEGLDVHTVDNMGGTAFLWACNEGNFNLLKFLHNGDSTLIKKSNKFNRTPLHYVAFGTGSVDVANYLINEGVDLRAKEDIDGATALHWACKEGNLNLVKFLHDRDFMLIKMSDNDKHTPLHYIAGGTGSVDVASYLINEGVDIHTKDSEGGTVFHWACMNGILNLVKFLHEKDSILIKMTNNNKCTPLHYVAMGVGSVDVAVYLISGGVDIHTEDIEGGTVFHWACKNGHLNLVRFLHEIDSSLITMVNEYKKTPLHYVALGTGSVDVADYLINEGVNMHAKDDEGGTAFHLACYQGNLNLVKFLHSRDSVLMRMSNNYNKTPLHYVALGTGSVEVAFYLISEGVDVRRKSNYGATGFHLACKRGHLNLAKFLHERDSVLITMSNNYNKTSLHYVAFGTGSVNVADYLINEGVDMHAKDDEGGTAFHLACYQGNLNLVKFLHSRDSVLMRMSNNYNKTPLHYVALGTGSVEVAFYLISEGVDVRRKSNYGATGFHLACKRGHLNLAKFLHERDSVLITMSNNYNKTSLHYVAFGTGSVNVADYLINEGVDMHAKDDEGGTAFHLACYQGNLNLVKFLHSRDSVLMRMSNNYNKTPLHYVALGTGSVEVAFYLISEGVDVRRKSNYGATGFHLACKRGHLNLAKFLHERDSVLITMSNNYNKTSLHYVAFGTGSVNVADYLINEGVDMHAKDDEGGTAFHLACYQGNLNLVKFLHSRDSVLMRMSNNYNKTPLHYVALGTGSVDMAVYLINEGVDVHRKDNYGATAFHLACMGGNLNLIKFLHEKDCTLIQMSNKNKNTPLHYVAEGTGSVDVAIYLINGGVDMHTKDRDGATGFHFACWKGNLNLVKFLHERDSRLIQMSDQYHRTPLRYLMKILHWRDTSLMKTSNNYNKTPLHYVALGAGSVDMAVYLINEGVDISKKDDYGATAFHLACMGGNLNLVKFLHDTDSLLIKMSNKYNKTPLHHVAHGTGSVDVTVFLINEGVDIHKEDTEGGTAFHLACKGGHLNLVKCLYERDSTFIQMSNKNNCTPLHYVAEGTGSTDTASFLISKGINVQKLNKLGQTALDIAKNRGYTELVMHIRETKR